jgi:hypothetical protein
MGVDEWTTEGHRITDEMLAGIRKMIENESALVIEHRFYRGARAPHRFICDDYSALEAYLRNNAVPGDSFWFWSFEDCCRDDNSVASGKVPDTHGRVPKGGAY